MIINVPIQLDTKCLLTKGQIIDFTTPFLENKVPSDLTLDVAKKLKIPRDKIFNHLQKFVGDTIEAGEILAEKKGLIGTKKVINHAKGIIKEVNHYTGEVVITTLISQEGNIKAYFKGEVEGIDNSSLKLKVEKAEELTIKAATADFGGETFYLKNPAKIILAEDASNKIMITEKISSYLMSKAEALGIRGTVSLKSGDSSLPSAQLKNPDDLQKILDLNLPYCLINRQYSKIYVYK